MDPPPQTHQLYSTFVFFYLLGGVKAGPPPVGFNLSSEDSELHRAGSRESFLSPEKLNEQQFS